ncbi:MAG TPA: HAD family hydrolase [Burkholderiaceae bacterium]|nr:HAD family hydrolase [Burkholderiaceae bacterium]
MNRFTPRAITLDLDDTLWPARPTLLHAEKVLAAWLAERAPATAALATPDWRKAARAAIARDHPDRLHDLGFMRRESLRRALVTAGEPASLAEPAFEVFLAARQQVTLYDDVLAVLDDWAGRYRLVALSNGNADIGRIGIERYFVASVSAHEAGHAKPDPRIFHEACRRAGVSPERTLHIGDDLELDVRAARTAGLQALWVRRPDLAANGAALADREALEPAPTDRGAAESAHADLHSIDRLLRLAGRDRRD